MRAEGAHQSSGGTGFSGGGGYSSNFDSGVGGTSGREVRAGIFRKVQASMQALWPTVEAHASLTMVQLNEPKKSALSEPLVGVRKVQFTDLLDGVWGQIQCYF